MLNLLLAGRKEEVWQRDREELQFDREAFEFVSQEERAAVTRGMVATIFSALLWTQVF